MDIGARLKQLRELQGLTLEQVGAHVGVNKTTVQRYESGEIDIKRNVAIRLAEILHTEPSYIMGWSDDPLPVNAIPYDPARGHRIPILGRIAAGLPIYAEQHIEGYTITDLNGGAEYFALRVKGDSMNAIGINDGYLIIVRRQEEVENGEVAVVMVGDDDATVKRFYATDSTVTLMPQSTNPTHQPQVYDLSKTTVKVLGKVVKVEFSL